MTRQRTVLAALALAALLAGCGGGEPAVPAARPAATPGTGPESLLSLRRAWRWVAPPPSYVGMPGADREGVAVTYGHSHVVLLDRAGRVRWTADRLRLRDVAPRLTPDAVLVPSEEGVVAFDRASGAVRWEARLDERANTPVVAAGLAVVTTWEGSLVALDRATGRVAWRRELPGPALGPAAANGDVVVASWSAEPRGPAAIVGVDPATGRERWAATLPPGGLSAPGLVAVEGRPALAVVVAGDLAAHAIATDSGEERWRAPMQGAGSPEVAPLDAGGGRVLAAHRLAGMVLLDAGGRVQWQADAEAAAVRGGPAGPGPGGRFALPLHDGRLLVAGPADPGTGEVLDPPGRVSGAAVAPGGELLVALREAPENDLTASSGW